MLLLSVEVGPDLVARLGELAVLTDTAQALVGGLAGSCMSSVAPASGDRRVLATAT